MQKDGKIDYLSSFFRNWKIVHIIILGLCIRFIAAPFAAHPLDMYVWYETGTNIVARGEFYSSPLYTYMPVWLLILTPFSFLYSFLAPTLGATPVPPTAALVSLGYPQVPLVIDWFFATLAKIPIILCDTATCVLLYQYIRRLGGSKQMGVMAGAAYFLNPFTIWMSAFWGVFDALPIMLSLLAFISLTNEKYERSGLFTGLAICTKYYALLIAPVAIIAIQKKNPERLRNYLIALILPVVLICLPFLTLDPSNFVKATLSPAVGSTVGRLNLWALAYLLNVKELPWFLSLLSLVIMGVTYFFVWKKLYKAIGEKSTTALLNGAILLSLFIFYFSFRILNEQYLLWAQPFLIIEYAIHRSNKNLRNPGLLALVFSGLQPFLFFFTPALTIPWANFGTVIEFFAQYRIDAVQYLINALSVFIWAIIILMLFYDIKYLWRYTCHE